MFGSYKDRFDNSFIAYAGMTTGSEGSDFVKYLAKIRTGTSEFALIMQEILFGERTNA
ncbi:hypothetical protein LCGC14_1143320 [marine sediment metagenome]|uniref:Uncharacterized protein n=1 Tax=marine sediment metagenome TaxID=412755 RepID=A0A0F9LXP4_9ZZZZ